MLCLEIEADAFLRHMVRTLVGTMVEVGRGERTVESFAGLLEGAPREDAGPTAPPHGLFLWDIRYGRRIAEGIGTGTNRPSCGRIPTEAGGAGLGRGDLGEETPDSEA